MVVMKLFLIFTISFLLFNIPVYGLMPSSIDEIEVFSEEETTEEKTSEELDIQIDEIKKEKLDLMKNISSAREERKVSLHPFVYNRPSYPSETIAMPDYRAAKVFTLPQSVSEGVRTGHPSPCISLKFLLNLIFFSIIALAFFAAHFYIRPKP
jgi:hypothetical protein